MLTWDKAVRLRNAARDAYPGCEYWFRFARLVEAEALRSIAMRVDRAGNYTAGHNTISTRDIRALANEAAAAAKEGR